MIGAIEDNRISGTVTVEDLIAGMKDQDTVALTDIALIGTATGHMIEVDGGIPGRMEEMRITVLVEEEIGVIEATPLAHPIAIIKIDNTSLLADMTLAIIDERVLLEVAPGATVIAGHLIDVILRGVAVTALPRAVMKVTVEAAVRIERKRKAARMFS